MEADLENRQIDQKMYTEIECYKFHKFPDTKILLHNTSENNEKQYFMFNIHKAYLRNSPFFKTMFRKDTFKESYNKNNTIILEELDEMAVKNYFLGHFLKTQTDRQKFINLHQIHHLALNRLTRW